MLIVGFGVFNFFFAAYKKYFVILGKGGGGGVYLREISYLLIKCFKTR